MSYNSSKWFDLYWDPRDAYLFTTRDAVRQIHWAFNRIKEDYPDVYAEASTLNHHEEVLKYCDRVHAGLPHGELFYGRTILSYTFWLMDICRIFKEYPDCIVVTDEYMGRGGKSRNWKKPKGGKYFLRPKYMDKASLDRAIAEATGSDSDDY